MKVLFLSTWFPSPPDNGAKLRVYHLLRALCNRHEVTLLSFTFDTARPDKADALQAICRSVQVVAANPFAVNRAGALTTFLSMRPMASRPIPAMSQLVTAEWRRRTYDAVIASTEIMADYALMAPSAATKVLEEHNSLTRWIAERYRGQRNPLQRARYWASWQKRRWYESRYYPRFDLVTMVSQEDRRTTTELLQSGGPRVEIVPNGVDCDHNRPGLAQPRPESLVYNGALTYNANYDAMQWFLAYVFPHIKQAVPGVTLAITGSITGVDTAGLALDDTVTLCGYVDDIRFPVAEASGCVVPIRQGGGTRLKILEAMALGTPVVSTSKGAEGLEVTPGHDILIADEPAEFAHQVIRLLRDAALRAQLAYNARRLVEQLYDWQQIGRQFNSIIEAAAGERNVGAA
jgi:glycosyltransferase involved in cell wall biosynthesis